jgi:hypothetical protein
MTKHIVVVLGALVVLAICCATTKEKNMVPAFQSSFIKRGTLDMGLGAGSELQFTSIWLPPGWAHNAPTIAASPLEDWTANNGKTVFDVDPLETLSGYDEVFVHIKNTLFPGSAGAAAPIVVRFGWIDNTVIGSHFMETALDQGGLVAVGPPVAGNSDNEGLQAGAHEGTLPATVRRYTASIAEYEIEPGGGRVFPLRVKHAILIVGIASLGAPDPDQMVFMQLVPRTVGAAR